MNILQKTTLLKNAVKTKAYGTGQWAKPIYTAFIRKHRSQQSAPNGHGLIVVAAGHTKRYLAVTSLVR